MINIWIKKEERKITYNVSKNKTEIDYVLVCKTKSIQKT